MGNSSGQSVVRRSPERADGKDESSTATSMQTVAPYADRWCPELPEPREIPVDQPPEAPRSPQQPLFRRLLPLVMVVAVLGMVAIMVVSGNAANPMTYLFPLIMVASMVGMVTGNQAQSVDERRRVYLRHIDRCRRESREDAEQQRSMMEVVDPDPHALMLFVGSNRMWERGRYDDDFAHVRIGTASQRARTHVSIGETNAVEDIDPICALALRRALRESLVLSDVPVCLALGDFSTVYIGGADGRKVVRSLLAQLITLHGPEAVQIMVCGHPRSWPWLPWIPHSDGQEAFSDPEEVVKALDELWSDMSGASGSRDDSGPQVLLIIDGAVPLAVAHHPAVASVIVVGTPDEDVMSETQRQQRRHVMDQWEAHAADEGIALRADHGMISALTTSGLDTFAQADTLSEQELDVLARSMARYTRPTDAVLAQHSSEGIDEVELVLGVATPLLVSPSSAWTEKRGAERLRIPLGLNSDGDPFYLDIKESAEGGSGPHGLCVGATGSGKSELLRTLVLSLVASHSPEQLNLVLVDFKGGATFIGMERLPHVAAVITNLDDESALVDRMEDALQGELTRRQEFLRAHGVSSSVEYTDMRRQCAGRGTADDSGYPPLPALVIIIDEFSELLSAHPGFIDTFVAIGRLGRSLGVHLLLATQRLEEGRLRGLDAHLSYRIGLRTFSAGESRIVLGVNDAHTLPKEPGYGLARVGGDSITAFRAAYLSRRWNGSVASEAAGSSVPAKASPQPSTILRTAIDRLSIDGPCASEVARFVPARTIWLSPLPDVLTMSELNTRTRRLTRDHTCSNEGLHITIGLIDAPRTQRQIPWTIDLRGSAGHVGIIGGPQSGTTTAARSVVTTLALSRTSDQAQFYVLDMGGSGLGTLERLPHTVAVVHRHEQDRILRLVNEVAVLAEDRREEWLRQGWSSVDAARDHGLSDIFVVIDGWHVITTDFPDVADALGLLIADGLSVGIHVIITANRWSALRPQIRDLLGTKIELSLGDPLESLIDRKLSERIPSHPGRAIVKWKGTGLHALVVHSTNQDIAEVTRIAAQRGDTRVPALRVLPDVLTRDELDPVLPPAIAMGRESARLSTWSWSTVANPAMLIVGKGESGRTMTLRSLIHGITSAYKPKGFGKKPATDQDAKADGSAADAPTKVDETSTDDVPTAAIVVIDPRRTLLAEVPSDYDAGYASTPSAADTLIAQLTTTMNMRLPGDSITPQELKNRSWWSGPEIFLLIDDYDLLTISPSVMSGFVSVLPHARDIGVHIVVARRASGMMRAAHDPLLAGMRAINGVVVLLSADKDDGPLFGVPLRPALPGRAHIVVNGTTSEIHFARAQLSPEDRAEDGDKKCSLAGTNADDTNAADTDDADAAETTTADSNNTEQK